MPSLPMATWPCHHSRHFKGRLRLSFDVDFLPTQYPRNSSNDRGNSCSGSACWSACRNVQSLEGKVHVRPQKYFACKVLKYLQQTYSRRELFEGRDMLCKYQRQASLHQESPSSSKQTSLSSELQPVCYCTLA